MDTNTTIPSPRGSSSQSTASPNASQQQPNPQPPLVTPKGAANIRSARDLWRNREQQSVSSSSSSSSTFSGDNHSRPPARFVGGRSLRVVSSTEVPKQPQTSQPTAGGSGGYVQKAKAARRIQAAKDNFNKAIQAGDIKAFSKALEDGTSLKECGIDLKAAYDALFQLRSNSKALWTGSDSYQAEAVKRFNKDQLFVLESLLKEGLSPNVIIAYKGADPRPLLLHALQVKDLGLITLLHTYGAKIVSTDSDSQKSIMQLLLQEVEACEGDLFHEQEVVSPSSLLFKSGLSLECEAVEFAVNYLLEKLTSSKNAKSLEFLLGNGLSLKLVGLKQSSLIQEYYHELERKAKLQNPYPSVYTPNNSESIDSDLERISKRIQFLAPYSDRAPMHLANYLCEQRVDKQSYKLLPSPALEILNNPIPAIMGCIPKTVWNQELKKAFNAFKDGVCTPEQEAALQDAQNITRDAKLSIQPSTKVAALSETQRQILEDVQLFVLKPAELNSVEALLKAGATPNITLGASQTPLTYAIQNQDIELVKLLLKYSVDVDFIPRAQSTNLQDDAALEAQKNADRSQNFLDQKLPLQQIVRAIKKNYMWGKREQLNKIYQLLEPHTKIIEIANMFLAQSGDKVSYVAFKQNSSSVKLGMAPRTLKEICYGPSDAPLQEPVNATLQELMLPEKVLEALYSTLFEKISLAQQEARKDNKPLMVLVGERHGSCYSLMTEYLIGKIADRLKIHTRLIEHPVNSLKSINALCTAKLNRGLTLAEEAPFAVACEPIWNYIQHPHELSQSYICPDNDDFSRVSLQSYTRYIATIDTLLADNSDERIKWALTVEGVKARDKRMVEESIKISKTLSSRSGNASSNPKDAIVTVGTSHLYGLLEENKAALKGFFHVLPINLEMGWDFVDVEALVPLKQEGVRKPALSNEKAYAQQEDVSKPALNEEAAHVHQCVSFLQSPELEKVLEGLNQALSPVAKCLVICNALLPTQAIAAAEKAVQKVGDQKGALIPLTHIYS